MARKKRGLRVYDADFWLIISLFCVEIPIYQEGNAASPRTFITEIAKRAEKHEDALMTIAEALKQEGIQLGRQEGKLEVARQMLDSGMAPATVKQFTGLTDSDILKLKK